MIETVLFYKGQSMGKSECQPSLLDAPAVVDKVKMFIANQGEERSRVLPGPWRTAGLQTPDNSLVTDFFRPLPIPSSESGETKKAN